MLGIVFFFCFLHSGASFTSASFIVAMAKQEKYVRFEQPSPIIVSQSHRITKHTHPKQTLWQPEASAPSFARPLRHPELCFAEFGKPIVLQGAEQPETVFPDEMSTTQSYNEKPLVETHRQGVDEVQLLELDGGKRVEFSMGAQGASFFDGGIQTSTPADDVFHAPNRYRSGSENLRGDRARFDDWRSQGPYTAPQPRVSSPVGPAPGAPPQGGGFHTTTIAVTSTQRSSVSDLTRICAPVSPSSGNTSKLAFEVRSTKLN